MLLSRYQPLVEKLYEVQRKQATELLAEAKQKINEGSHTTYYGKALAVVRGGDAPGKIKVTVKAKGLLPKTLELDVI